MDAPSAHAASPQASQRRPAMVMFNELDRVPDGMLDAAARDLHGLMPPATLVHLPGRDPRPLFVSVLLHGNEDAGLQAIQQVLRRAGGQPLPRALSIFFGNLEAARHNLRFLPPQPDFNRIWSGEEDDDGGDTEPHRRMARSVLRSMRSRGVFAAIDLHNNTGRNPLYSCVTPSSRASHRLAALFSDIAIHTDTVGGTLASAFATHCPAVTCECGEIGNALGVQRAAELVERCLSITPEELAKVDDSGLTTYEAFATVKVPDGLSVSATGDGGADVQLAPDIDLLNFHDLPAGHRFATVAPHVQGEALLAFDSQGAPLRGIFARRGDEVHLALASTPAMLTLQEDAIRKTCLGYLMRRAAAPTAS